MNEKSQAEAERRARLLKSRAERLPDIKKQFEENWILEADYANSILIKLLGTWMLIQDFYRESW